MGESGTFLLDEQRRPRFVAVCRPITSALRDSSGATRSTTGRHIRTGYSWCIDRIRALLAHVDVIRLDHFRAFAAAWHVPAGAPTAEPGEWVPGPGAEFSAAVQNELGALPFIAEDLGLITPDVSALRDQFGIPGTRVLQFAFDGNPRILTSQQLLRQHRGVHGHARQSHDPRMVRNIAGSGAATFLGLSGRPEGEIRDAAPS